MAIRAVLASPRLGVDPGSSASSDVTLHHDGPSAVTVAVSVTGDARPFSWVAPERVILTPGVDATVRVGFHAPRGSVPAAGPLPFVVAVTGAGPDEAATAEGVLEIRPFGALSAILSPDPTDAGRHTLSIGNRGNAPVGATVRGEADGERIDVHVEPGAVVVPLDARVEAAVRVTRAEGSQAPGTFRVIATPDVGTPVTVEGHIDPPPVPKPKRRGAVVAVAGVVVLTVALVAAGLTLLGGDGPGDNSTRATDDTIPAGGAPLEACPGKSRGDAYGIRNLTEREIANLPKTFTFLRLKADRCSPMRFNPCAPVHFIQNVAAAPPLAAENVREAFRRLGRATGITFVDDGVTDENARAGPYIPERYGARWAPILIVWDHFPAEQTSGRQQILGNTNVYREREVIVSGRLRFNVDAYNNETTKAPIEAGFGPPAGSGTGPIGRENITWGRIVLHELAHLAGLGHTSDFGSLMYPDAAQQTARPADFMRPDLEGLRYLGREAGCLETPPVPAS